MEGKKRKPTKRSKTGQKNTPSWSWIDLPRDVTANILHRLGAIEILESAQLVCTTWLNVCKDPCMWRVIDMTNKGREEKTNGRHNRLYQVFCKAIDLSQGQLIDIRFEYFGGKAWFPYLIERSPQLRCLRIASCKDIYGYFLAGDIVKFPLLEELHLFDMRTLVFAEHIETIGSSCPKLKSLTYDHNGFPEVIKSDMLALAVAKTMPGLLHLRLFGNKLTNKGLQAILDACPDLESLDLRQCYNVVLEGDLEKRCNHQIKSLKLPLDATGDEWVPVNHPDNEHDRNEAERIIWELRDYEKRNRDIYCYNDPLSYESDDPWKDYDWSCDYGLDSSPSPPGCYFDPDAW